MSVRRMFVGLLLVAFIAACGGGSPTPAPAGATQNPAATADGGGGGGATDGPDATQGGGGGGGGDGTVNAANGKVHIEISGPVSKTAEYGFIPAASVFGGAQGSALNFSNEGAQAVVSILISADGSVVVSYSTDEFQAPASECTTSNWNVGDTSASGSFDCTSAIVIMANGTTTQNAKLKGNFEARK